MVAGGPRSGMSHCLSVRPSNHTAVLPCGQCLRSCLGFLEGPLLFLPPRCCGNTDPWSVETPSSGRVQPGTGVCTAQS